ncbi:GNAT family N-acetyltransferase [Arsenophonus apicola]|jgi:ribosomal protein S18 acetylase RimI-like enzyme|uniref:GNAT family N-acetyltransferase n=1 Tax=Arsenophonus apicola TaxID=2879119 RepID=UPI001CDBDFD7|nr:GNAT family N-acetyltransferase [Arsenophonus apicola]UBX29949.1 GNAT family N-acetyltransferase [Arsenophonus apicola]
MLVRLALPTEAEKLVNIERSAATLFRQIPELAWLADAQGKSINQHLEFIVDGDCWVAVVEQQLVGFIEVEVMDQALHIWELSVASRWQRRGIGQILLQQAIIQAKQLSCDHVTLTTFRDVAWNGAYYQKLGFTIIPAEKLTLPLQAILKREVAYGFTASSRCAMQYTL